MDHLFLELKDATLDNDSGYLEGYGAVKGNLDRVGDVITGKGAFINIDEFVNKGSMMFGHRWGSAPIGTIEAAKEDSKGLYFKGHFHTTEEAQSVRTIVKERLERHKSVGLSIGYKTLEWKWIDVEGRQVREITKLEVYEISVVPIPANPKAEVAKVKEVSEDTLPEKLQRDTMLAVVDQWKRLSQDENLNELSEDDKSQIVASLKGFTELLKPKQEGQAKANHLERKFRVLNLQSFSLHMRRSTNE